MEVIAGGGRTRAIGLLVAEGKVDPEHEWVAYKVIPRELARVASLTENGRRKEMHPYDQITGFRELATEGKTPAQIGDLLGYSVRHVQRMLKLGGLAPAILESLAKGEITSEHCQALALVSDHTDQLRVYDAACESAWNGVPEVRVIRSLILSGEVSTDCAKFRFVGETAFSHSEIRTDLFSDEQGGFVDALVLDTALLGKLQYVADGFLEAEGWGWCTARMSAISHYGDDAKIYRIQDTPASVYTDRERQRLEEIEAQDGEHDDAAESEVAAIECAARVRGWSPEQKAESGVVVSWCQGEVHVQRGVKKREQPDPAELAAAVPVTHHRQPEPVDEICAPLLTKMSSERTLAVQAALMQQPEKAIALLTWTLCLSVFGNASVAKPATVSLECSHHTLTETAPSGKSGAAYLALMQEKERLSALLPEDWTKDATSLFLISEHELKSLMSFCTACSLDGVQTRQYSYTRHSRLDALENSLGFHLRDWWQPTKDNFFILLKKSQIEAALTEAGLSDAASNVVKMKKGDAAEQAEAMMADNRWVPVWMQGLVSTEAGTEANPVTSLADAD
ncbi:chromosome partitioning protein ParB [Pantoea cypripedii]|uniref:Uncharacterized protein YubM n=1 Tax=Pantoea cypripedii TaxID=55209 RepID=A0A1X1ENM3_PANCY|nr:chromosome partitioning protein ParB [Pantoea cypripedii]